MQYHKIIGALALVFLSIFTSSAQEENYITNARQLIYEGKRSGEGYFSGDGNMLVFQSERIDENPFYQIYTLDFETGDVKLISTGDGKTTCAYFNWANNKEILFGSTHSDPKTKQLQQEELDFRASGQKRRYSWDYDDNMHLYVADLEGNILRQVTNEKGYDAEGSFSPNGKYIAFSSTRSAYTDKLTPEQEKMKEYDMSYFGEIYIMDADGKNVKRLTNSPGYDGGPFFSPDGKKIIWRRFNEKGTQADVFTMNIDGTDVKQITEFGSMSWAPYFHPSGEYIIFASNKLGYHNFELYIVDKNGEKEPVQVTYTDGFDGLPVFSPDGNNLSWTSTRTASGVSQLFYGKWNHEAALQALKAAPKRGETGSTYTPQIKANELQEKVSYLASDELEGRMTGSKGIKEAAEFLKAQFKSLGLTTVGNLNSYTQSFDFIADVSVNTESTWLQVPGKKKPTVYELYKDYVPASFSKNGSVSGDVVFVGYGLRTPEGAEIQYDSYAGVDVKDKIVIVLKGEPDHLTDEEQKQVITYSTFRYKTMVARELGAKAIVMIDLYDKTFKGIGRETVPGDMGIPAVLVNPTLANDWLKTQKKTLDGVKESLLNYNPHEISAFAFEKFTLDMAVQLDRNKSNDVNVLAMLPAATKSDEYIIIGGHYDHLGYGETGSRAGEDEINQIHNGADDNASGTATVIELAEYFAQLKKDQPELVTANLVFVLWSGEELGLVGSSHFTANPPVDLSKVKAYVNFDMVGRLTNNKLILQGAGSSELWRKLIEKRNIKAGFQLSIQDDPYVPTDGMALYQAKVPILCFFTGITDEYHTPSDDVGTLNFEGMERIGLFAKDLIVELMKPENVLNYQEVAMSPTRSSSKGFSVYLGTIPDYAAEVAGVKLSGVRPDGPAAKAGLKENDIIIGLAGKAIGNIYDYTYALAELKPNETVKIIIKRGEEELTLDITPEAK